MNPFKMLENKKALRKSNKIIGLRTLMQLFNEQFDIRFIIILLF
jgi:hypothetical protein